MIYPSTSREFPPGAGVYPWYALKVRTRSEELAGSILASRGFTTYVPVTRENKQFVDRRRMVSVPAFPGYVFCRFDIHRKAPVLSSPSVEYIVSFCGEPAIVPDEELENIRRALEMGGKPVEYLAKGQPIQIASGTFAGMTGVLVRCASNDRFVVSLPLLQRSVAVEVDQNCIHPISLVPDEAEVCTKTMKRLNA